MTQTKGRPGSRPDANTNLPTTVPQPDSPLWDEDHWTNFVDWWTNPALAYVAGLADGQRLERERIAEQDAQLHRVAVRSALDTISRVDRWELAR